jgi:hypothetical protein
VTTVGTVAVQKHLSFLCIAAWTSIQRRTVALSKIEYMRPVPNLLTFALKYLRRSRWGCAQSCPIPSIYAEAQEPLVVHFC